MIQQLTNGSKWRHYKGGEYEIIAIAEKAEIPATAIYLGKFADLSEHPIEDNGQISLYECPVSEDSSYFATDSETSKPYVFYREVSGCQWCRSANEFVSNVDENTPRFVRIDGGGANA
jgi:hypothetical protein